MNRPFLACGVLLTLLTGGMLAVGNASSTTVAEASPVGRETATIYCGCPLDQSANDLWPCDAAWLATDACYASGCGLDRNSGTVYSLSPEEPQPVAIVLLSRDTAVARHECDCFAHYDPAYDSAVYAPADSRQEKLASTDSWLDPDERVLQDRLTFFQSLIAQGTELGHKHPFYDEQAAAEYTAAEIAAAEAGGAIRPVAVAHTPRFSALICTLPDSNLAFDLRPALIALQVRSLRIVEGLGLQDDYDAAAQFIAEFACAAESAERPQWSDYEDFFSNLTQDQRRPHAVGPGFDPSNRLSGSVAADMLLHVAEVADWVSRELRRITRPYVAKSHSFEQPAVTTR